MNETYPEFVARMKNHSCKAQLGQDLWVLWATNCKRNGYFVEVGAGDGMLDSNTWLLEKEYGWRGILSEPNRSLWGELSGRRSGSIIQGFALNDGRSPIMEFREVTLPYLSSLAQYGKDELQEARRNCERSYPVKCVSLDGLLEMCNAPITIDYLSLDLEGAEYDVLRAFSFKYSIHLMTVEHNDVEFRSGNRHAIRRLMLERGYHYWDAPEITKWDDWYIRRLV